MAEKLILKARVAKTYFADPIAKEEDLANVEWKEQPLTLRDDEISIVEEEPEEDEVFSHENDTPEDSDFVGKGLITKGSFIKATREQMAELMGGAVKDGKYHRAANKVQLNKAIKYLLKNGEEIIIPNAKGYVNLDANLAFDGKLKFPFQFKALVASPAWNCDIIL